QILREGFVRLIYEALLNECRAGASDDKIEKLFWFRQKYIQALKLENVDASDHTFAGILASAQASILQFESFVLYTELRDDFKAEETLLSILQGDHLNTKDPKHLEAFLTFFSRIPYHKQAVAMKICQAPGIGDFLKLNPLRSFKTLLNWHQDK